jgi:hypothetical protein
MFAWRERLYEASALLARLLVPAVEPTGRAQHAVGCGQAHCHDVGIEHHEREGCLTT